MKLTNFQVFGDDIRIMAHELVQKIDLSPAIQVPMYAFKGVLYGTFEEAYQRALEYLKSDSEVEADSLSNIKEWR